MTAASPDQLLPPHLVGQVEAAAGATLAAIKPRGGGGASREGAEITLVYPDGRRLRAYLTYDLVGGGASEEPEAVRREAAVLKAFSGPLRDAGVRAPPYIASIPESRAHIMGFVEGDANFRGLKSPQERSAVAADFMAQLAALHRIDVAATPVEGLGAPRPVGEMVRDYIGVMRRRSLDQGADPLIILSLDLLEQTIPADPAHPVIAHSDCGPGNFLFKDGRVSALLDWEIVDYGDPMSDLGMLCLRDLLQPFVPLPEAFAAYEAAGGARVDLDKVRYYRLYHQTHWAGRGGRFTDPSVAPPPVIGMSLVYAVMHRNVLTGALAEAVGAELAPLEVPEVPTSQYHRTFEVSLSDLRDVIVPRLDQQAAAKAKGLARLVKFWRDMERYGPTLRALETDELSAALGRRFADVFAGRRALCDAILAHDIDPRVAIRLCQRMTTSDRVMLADAMGALADARFSPLS